MWDWILRPVGRSSVPAVMLVVPLPNSRQKRLLPQVLQKPRSAVADEGYQESVADEVNVIDADGALLMAA